MHGIGEGIFFDIQQHVAGTENVGIDGIAENVLLDRAYVIGADHRFI